MRKPGLQAKGTTRKHKRAKAVEKGDPRLNLVDRMFEVDGRNRLWVGDITYVCTSEGRPCLAAVIDAWHRKVVGRPMSDRITEKLATGALEQAVGRENPPCRLQPRLPRRPGQPVHIARIPALPGVAQSMSRPGNPWDNALAESFFRTLKRELVDNRGCETREEAKQDIFKRIELYYNTRRMHSSIGYAAPCDLERDVA